MKKGEFKLKNLLIYSFCASIASLILIASYGAYIFTDLNTKSKFLKKDITKDLRLISEMKLSTVQVQQWLTDISATRALSGFNDGYKEAQKWADKFRAVSAEFRQSREDSKLVEQQLKLESSFEDY